MEISNDILTLAALVAAFVGVTKAYGVNPKHASLIALAVAAVLVLVPAAVQEKLVYISIVGLTASGAYNYTKNRTGDKE